MLLPPLPGQRPSPGALEWAEEMDGGEELDEEERAKTQRAMGMKMEQLKAEREQIDHAHDDH